MLERRTQKRISKSPLIFGLSLLECYVPSAEARISLHWVVWLWISSSAPHKAEVALSPMATQSGKVSAVTQLSEDPQPWTGPGDSGSSTTQRGQQAVAEWVPCPLPTDSSCLLVWVSHFPPHNVNWSWHRFWRW